MSADTAAYEALIEFLYQAPLGLMQTTADGTITMINPMSAQLLMPLVRDGELANVFDVLAPVAPDLRLLATAFGPVKGMICEGLRVTVPAVAASPRPTAGAEARGAAPRILALSLLKLNESALMVSLTDVSDSVQQEQQRLDSKLRDLTRTDSLTSMPNRAVVLEWIERATAAARADPAYEFAVLFINADRFSSVNVTLGTAVGDELLRLMASRLNSAVRPRDTVLRPVPSRPAAARLGGDEFVVVLEGLRCADDANGVALRLLDALAKPYGIGEHQVHASVSMGVVLRAQAQGDANAVLQQASIAMREAKRAGGARHAVFEPPMQARAAHRGSTEHALRHALEVGELYVVYQPIVGMARGACAGVEALVRWRHPTRGLVPPVEFIGVAEECGLIGPLGVFVLNEACRQFVAWQRTVGEAAPRTLSVNLSRAQLGDADLVDAVRLALQRSGMPAHQLQLEITESLAAQDERVQARLHELKALGLSLALDDFGTGYSSLACLHLLPVDVVKIDRSFVSQLESSPHHRVLVEATVRVAQSLRMGTVAEGIETEGQAAALAALQCDKGQGYLFARPMDAALATDWLRERHAQALGLPDPAGSGPATLLTPAATPA